MKRRKTYGPGQRLAAFWKWFDGVPLEEIVKGLSVPMPTLKTWYDKDKWKEQKQDIEERIKQAAITDIGTNLFNLKTEIDKTITLMVRDCTNTFNKPDATQAEKKTAAYVMKQVQDMTAEKKPRGRPPKDASEPADNNAADTEPAGSGAPILE